MGTTQGRRNKIVISTPKGIGGGRRNIQWWTKETIREEAGTEVGRDAGPEIK